MPDPYGYRAIIRSDFPRDQAIIEIGRDRPDGRFEQLMADGLWHQHDAMTVPIGETGLRLPHEALAVIAEAIARHQGTLTDSATEAGVLREWLAVEQRRVDAILSRQETT